MKKLILLLALVVPAFSQYRIFIFRESGSKVLIVPVGPNIRISEAGVDCVVPPPIAPPVTFVFFPALGQKAFTVTEPGTVRAVEVHRNGVLLTDQGTLPDYSLVRAVFDKTVTLADLHAAQGGDIVQVKLWH